MSVSAGEVAGWVVLAIGMGLVILSSRSLKRTGGREWKFHAIYVAIAAVLSFVLPLSVKQAVFSTAGIVVAGNIFPVIESLRALCTPSTADDMEWLQYWVEAGSVYFATAYFKDYNIGSEQFQLYWFQFIFFFFIWLYLPFTDGATLCFDYITKPILSPIIDPLTARMTSWISGLVMTVVNASHLWFLWAFFMFLPKGLKRFVTVAVGTAFPLMASVTAVSTDDKADDTFWLTYWSCYGLLFLAMDITETWLGQIWGFYTVVIVSTVYLMLPMTQGADKVFRNVLVPLAGLKESLLMRDAVMLKKELMDSLPADRQQELRKLITYSFNTETPDDDADDDANDDRVEFSAANAKLIWSKSMWSRKLKGGRSRRVVLLLLKAHLLFDLWMRSPVLTKPFEMSCGKSTPTCLCCLIVSPY